MLLLKISSKADAAIRRFMRDATLLMNLFGYEQNFL